MTAISNMNIVVQQSGGAKNAQNVRPPQEYSQLVATQQKEKDLEQRTTIQQSEDAKQTQLDKDRPEKRRHKRHARSRRHGEAVEQPEQKPQDSGSLLNTVA